MSNFHRIQWIDRMIKNERYPNTQKICLEFEISKRQVLRDIEYMKDSLGAPIEYSKKFKGYYYADKTFALPNLFINAEQKQMLGFLAKQYSKFKSDISFQLAELFFKLSGNEENSKKSDIEKDILIKIKNPKVIEFYDKIEKSIVNRKKIKFDYLNSKNEISTRCFESYKIFKKYGILYVVGKCNLKNEIRIFRLDRIKSVVILEEKYEKDKNFNEEEYKDEQVKFERKAPYKLICKIEEDSFNSTLKLKKIEKNLYEINFYNSEEIIAELIKQNSKFEIISPNWLKEKLFKRITEILKTNFRGKI